MPMLSDVYAQIHTRLKRKGEDRAFRAHLRRVVVDDVNRCVEDDPVVLQEIGHLVADESPLIRDVRRGLSPLFCEFVVHSPGPSLGRACQSLRSGDENGSVEVRVTELFRSEDLYEFLIGLRRLLVRTEKGITLDVNRLERDLRAKFQYDDPRVTSGWFLDFYRASPQE